MKKSSSVWIANAVALLLILLELLLVGGVERSILAPPPLNSTWEEWVEKMPLPLKNDFEMYIQMGEGQIDWAATCECAPVSNDRFSYIFHNGSFWFPNAKASLKMTMDRKFFVSLGQSLTQRYGTLPSIKMYMDTWPEGNETESVCPCNPHYPPVFVLSKKVEEKHFIRRPTMYMNGYSKKALELFEKRIPWEDKNETVYYQGAVGSDKGSLPRLIALIFQYKLKQRIPEVGKLFYLNCAGECPRKSDLYRALSKVNPKLFERLPWLGMNVFSQYKYNLHLPGHFTAGYSRAIQFLLPQLTVPLFWENPYREYYYDWLVEGKHYLSVKPENLAQTVLWLKNHDDEAKQIAENGPQFVFDYLQEDDFKNYWEWLVLTYVRLSKNNGPPDLSKHCMTKHQCRFFQGTHKVYKRGTISAEGVEFIDPVIDSIIDGLLGETTPTKKKKKLQQKKIGKNQKLSKRSTSKPMNDDPL